MKKQQFYTLVRAARICSTVPRILQKKNAILMCTQLSDEQYQRLHQKLLAKLTRQERG